MAENFQAAGICGGTWWTPSKNAFGGCVSTCSLGIGATAFGWQNMESTPDVKAALSCTDSNNGSTVVFAQKQQQETDSDSGGSSVTIDSTLKMMGLGFSSSGNSSSDWNHSILHEDMNPSLVETSQDCQGFLSVPSSYGYPSSNLITHLYEPESSLSILNNNRSINNFMSSNTTSCSNDLSSLSWPKTDPFLNASPVTIPKQQASGFNFSNSNTPFWSSSTSALDNNGTNSIIPSLQPAPQFLSTQFQEKHMPCLKASTIVRDSGSAAKKASDEPATKKPRIATPSPLPTFKVRKENLRDQITALQQLVSPFGKTDTASVLQEAIEYIKFLHDQVNVLSTPYMKQGAAVQQQQSSDKPKDKKGNDQDLRSRGLCLVPISSTFPVANETTADFWTPSFGGNFR